MVAKDNDQRLVVNGERVNYWLGQGAQATERVQKLLSQIELMAKVEMRDQPKKSAPGKKRAEKEAAEAEAAAEAAFDRRTLKQKQQKLPPLKLKHQPKKRRPKKLLLKRHLLRKLKAQLSKGMSWLKSSLKLEPSLQPMA